MGLGDLLFGKKSETTKAGQSAGLSSQKKMKVGDVVVSPRYNIKKSLIGKDMRRLKTIDIDGHQLTKQDLESMMSGISRSNRRNITYKDLEKFIKDPRKNKMIKGWANKKKFLEIEKKMAVKELAKYKKNTVDNTSKIMNDRSARKIQPDKRKFVSPKEKSITSSRDNGAQENSLGMKNKGFQRGHGGGVEGASASRARSCRVNEPAN